MNYKQKCLDIYYASDVVNKELTEGCEFMAGGDFMSFSSYGRIMKNGWIYWDTSSGNFCVDNSDGIENEDTVGHPPTGFDWLRLIMRHLNTKAEVNRSWVSVSTIDMDLKLFRLDLKTGEPTDWEALYKLIS